MSGKIKVSLEHSINGTTQRQRATVRALGLSHRGSTKIVSDTPQIQGMIKKVLHLIKTEAVQG